MANIGHGEKFEALKARLMLTAAKLFLAKGYTATKLVDISRAAECDNNAVPRVFGDKDGLLAELVAYVLEGQFKATAEFLANIEHDKILFYAAETTLQLYMAESSEHIRELYSIAYSSPKSSSIIYDTITKKLEDIFKEYLPHLNSNDFYELELASGGIMRSFLTVPCDRYFTMERKVKRFLETTFLVYEVPKEKIAQAIEFVSEFDYPALAQRAVSNMLGFLERNLEKFNLNQDSSLT
ncbi:MAG: TetR/AcrR family transcriptional regulator [Clostridia bacterium]|nr:TetR/AcrR family transcriptional regulator [Clostridia bacterium]